MLSPLYVNMDISNIYAITSYFHDLSLTVCTFYYILPVFTVCIAHLVKTLFWLVVNCLKCYEAKGIQNRRYYNCALYVPFLSSENRIIIEILDMANYN